MTYRQAMGDPFHGIPVLPMITDQGQITEWVMCVGCGERFSRLGFDFLAPCPKCGATMESEVSEFYLAQNKRALPRFEEQVLEAMRGER